MLSKFNIRKRSHTVGSPTRTSSSASISEIDENFVELSKSVIKSEAKGELIFVVSNFRPFI